MNAFVTGGSGFVGRNLVETLLARGVHVRALVRSDGAAAAVQALGAEPVRGDLDDEAAMATGMSGCGVIYHCAAKVDDWGPKADFLRVNVGGTEHALAAARAAGVRRFVHVSTEAVLVGGPPIVQADESRRRPSRPLGLYPLTKGLAEDRVLAASSMALTTVVVRPRLIWGAGDTSLLPKVVDAVHKGRFRWIAGGRYLTSTCHVRNVCEGAMLAAERGRSGNVYFLTDGEPVEFRAFLTEMLRAIGVDPGARSIPRWVARASAALVEAIWTILGLRSAPPVTRTAVRLAGEEVTVDDAKARRDLGYVGLVTRAQGLEELRRPRP